MGIGAGLCSLRAALACVRALPRLICESARCAMRGRRYVKIIEPPRQQRKPNHAP